MAGEVEELFEEEHSVLVELVVDPSLSEALNFEEQTFLPALFLILVSGEEEEGEDDPVYE